MILSGSRVVGVLVLALTLGTVVLAQRGREPDIGYVYPAGGQVGTEVTVTIGGMSLDGATDVYVSGQGIDVSNIDFDRPLTNREVNVIQDQFDKAQQKLEDEGKSVNWRRRTGAVAELLELLAQVDVTEEDLQKVEEYRQRRNDPKRQLNPQIEQTVTATLSIAGDAAPGRREVRVLTPSGLSNPLGFYVSLFPEFLEVEPNDAAAGEAIGSELPIVLNGQIMPGDVDRFRFQAEKGDKLVLKASARELMPYLADAVPGWFQATMALYDENGREVAYADDFQFHPDPVLFYRIPQSGLYEVEIKDSIYRGREDFVYRIEVGELPFLKTVYPMGARVGKPIRVQVAGWNLPVDTLALAYQTKEVGQFPVSVESRRYESNEMPFDVDDYPEYEDQEPNNDIATAQTLKPECIVNGRINEPGDWDVFHFRGRKGGRVMLEVTARRLNSPVDSLLKLTDANGTQIMVNDDTVDKGAGLVTHHADSTLLATLPATGDYYVHMGDTQKKGGDAYVYRLRVSARRPDFDLRIVPSAVNARPGSVVPVTVYALRRDGFIDDIEVKLVSAPEGFELHGGRIPADKESEDLTLTVPRRLSEGVYSLSLIGAAVVKGRQVERPVVPADDMMQAFIYHHLVPADEMLVAVSKKASVRRVASGTATADQEVLKIPLGSTARYQLAIPNRTNLDDVKVELTNPPDGVTILRVIHGIGGLVMLFSADAEASQAGTRGNLQLNIYIERTVPGTNGRPGSTRKVPIGAFPPVPFEVTGR